MIAGKRLAALYLVIGLLLAVCIARSVMLVREKGDEYNKKALALSAGSGTVIQAKPGEILDRNGAYLACTIRVYRLILDPKVMKQTESSYKGSAQKTVDLLSEVLGLDKKALVDCITENEDSAYIRFMEDQVLSEDEYDAWNEAVAAYTKERTQHNKEHPEDRWTARIAGVWFEQEYRRDYPEKELLSKVIGFSTEDVTQGITGLELSYNDVLRGKDGRQIRYIADDGSAAFFIRPVAFESAADFRHHFLRHRVGSFFLQILHHACNQGIVVA